MVADSQEPDDNDDVSCSWVARVSEIRESIVTDRDLRAARKRGPSMIVADANLLACLILRDERTSGLHSFCHGDRTPRLGLGSRRRSAQWCCRLSCKRQKATGLTVSMERSASSL